MRLKIEKRKVRSTDVLRFEGQLDMIESFRIPSRLQPFTRKKIGPVVIDLGECVFVDSQWLAVFIRFNEQSLACGNTVYFLVLPGTIFDLFVSTGLSKVFTMINSLDEIPTV